MGRSMAVLPSLPPEELGLEWKPPEQLICTAVVPRQPLGSDPPTHLDIHFSFTLFDDTTGKTSTSEGATPSSPSRVATPTSPSRSTTPTGRVRSNTDSHRLLLRLGKVASEGGGGRIRTTADVPLALSRSVERSMSGLWRVTVRAKLSREKSKGAFEHGPKLDASFILPSAEVTSGDVPPTVRSGCLEALQKLSREATADNQAKLHYDMILRQLLIEWRLNSKGDEAMWLDRCAMPEERARGLLRESLLQPLEECVQRLREALRPNPPASTPAGLWEAWDSGKKALENWKVMLAAESQAKAQSPSNWFMNGSIGVALEDLLVELSDLVASGWCAIAKPVEEPYEKMQAEVGLESPNMEVLWRCRGESHSALVQWGHFRLRVSLLLEASGEEADIGNRLNAGVYNLRRSLVIIEDVLVHDLEARLQEMRRILGPIQETSRMDKPLWTTYSDSIHLAIEYSRNLLRSWSETEEHSASFWDALEGLGEMMVREAYGKLGVKDVWLVWGHGFRAAMSWMQLGQQNSVLLRSENETFKALLQDLRYCLAELVSQALQVLSRSLNYPLLYAEEEFGNDFGKIHIGGYEALELCIKNQPRMVALSTEIGAGGTLGQQLVDLAAQLQTLVLEDIHSTSQDLALASPEETKEVMELIEALSTLDFDLTRWNFMRPCVEKMAMGPGAVGEMMKRLLSLADRVRAARDLKDRQYISSFISSTLVGRTASQIPTRSGLIDLASSNITSEVATGSALSFLTRKNSSESLAPSMNPIESLGLRKLWTAAEVIVGTEYHQIKEWSTHTSLISGVREAMDAGTLISRLDVAPLVPADASTRGLTQAFLDTVEHYNPNLQESADDIVKRHSGWLPTDVKARKIALLTMYTVNSLFCEVSKALYENDRQLLWANAGYIRELRDTFLVGQTSSIVEPFVGGRVVRSLMLEEDRLQTFCSSYSAGSDVYFPSFISTFIIHDHRSSSLSDPAFTTSTFANKEEKSQDGNVILRISCGKMASPKPGQYYPASVKAFSAFPSEDEVIFPPHCFLRVVNIEIECDRVVVDMETTEAKCVWQSIRDEDWCTFSSWAACNTDLVDTRTRQFSLIGTVAESISKPLRSGDPNPFDVCLKHGADINELHEQETPLSILEKKLSQASGADRFVFQDWLIFLRAHGAAALRPL